VPYRPGRHRVLSAAYCQGGYACHSTRSVPVNQVRAQLESAKWELSQTTVTAPADGYAINVQLRPGSFTVAFPITPAITLVEEA
jgi:multidrug resistance efflux pump